jgi:hypothetical protein
MRKIQLAVAMGMLALFGMTLGAAQDRSTSMSFFVTGEGAGNGANLGGLDGAGLFYCFAAK